ncbi:MAG: alanine--tRNA ligase [Fusobacteriota bacterium]
MLSSNEIRNKFINFFEKKGHKAYESASLIPDDPTLLLTVAGMVPYKKYFMGKEEPEHTRVVSCQKCMRTNDLENVGKTARHHTFFEMLGNFSFGDYFKKDAIKWSWEFITEELGLKKEDLWISVYKDDNESVKIWNEEIGVPLEKIAKMGEKDNFWTAGPTGSCGPCSEIYIDLGEERGCGSPDCAVGCDCDRYMEIWNLVFTEYDRLEDGSLKPLPKKNIDTGMGLERIASVLQGVKTNFDTDLLKPIIKKITEITNTKYNDNKDHDFSIRVIADHIRSIIFLISDGVLPSNDGRGYVLRRILRRAVRHGRLLNYEEEFLYLLVDKVVELMKGTYSELEKQKEHIKKIISIEEKKFAKTLDQGIEIAQNEIQKIKKENEDKIDSKIVFKLYDTYGFPYELTEEICQENNIKINFDEFKKEMEKQKMRARGSREVIKEKLEEKFITDLYDEYGKTEFVSDSNKEIIGKILYIDKVENDKYDIVFDKTPFYAESGGQIYDTGQVVKEGALGEVILVSKRKGMFFHRVKTDSEFKKGDTLELKINKIRRNKITKNHTATHLLHSALHEVVGEHVHQKGSSVDSERLRFDFSHYSGLNQEELEEIERIVNNWVLDNKKVEITEEKLEDAKNMGAQALFSDKYGEKVRVVNIPETSIELCGGTHVKRTGDIGLFKIISSSGISSGVRRIEAITGMKTLEYIRNLEYDREKISELLKTDENSLEEKIRSNLEEKKNLEREIESLESKLASYKVNDFLEDPMEINGAKVIIKDFKDQDVSSLRKMIDKALNSLDSSVVILGSNNGNAIFLVGITEDLVSKGLNAGKLVSEIAKKAGGNGGGRPNFAQAGGKNGNKVKEALKFARELIKEKL